VSGGHGGDEGQVDETVLGPGDTVISDGRSPEEALHRQRTILPLAILSRSLLELSHFNAS